MDEGKHAHEHFIENLQLDSLMFLSGIYCEHECQMWDFEWECVHKGKRNLDLCQQVKGMQLVCVILVRFSNACVGILMLGKDCRHHSFCANFQILSFSNVMANEQARKVVVNGIGVKTH